ncbi:MAG: nitrous oxide-stimulated promoter family protein [Chloroflexi bacterium]|jgi:hypothetical protein|nr:nitrous oxide-stimulated promoter family protein [Chloroflexota bacterium]MBT7080379.1 nitrous oxide-stimulated promoter family protein [Chloroflexota bacterium]MBT7289451.1 nitrous oxide-stimulated promoter family protein [Chloroflexota bacterium]
MSKLFSRFTNKKEKDLRVLRDFIHIYCREKHKDRTKLTFSSSDASVQKAMGDKKIALCPNCSKLLNHGMVKLLMCPYDPKPMCKKCTTHCYAPGYRESIKEVMRFSGIYLIKHGRLDMILHYFL